MLNATNVVYNEIEIFFFRVRKSANHYIMQYGYRDTYTYTHTNTKIYTSLIKQQNLLDFEFRN